MSLALRSIHRASKTLPLTYLPAYSPILTETGVAPPFVPGWCGVVAGRRFPYLWHMQHLVRCRCTKRVAGIVPPKVKWDLIGSSVEH